MTSTAVVLGIAALGKPWETPDCDCATDAMGSIAMRKGIINFTGYPFDSVWLSFCFLKEYDRTLRGQKNYSSAKHFIKKFLASINICSRLWGDEVIRTTVSTPAILENNS